MKKEKTSQCQMTFALTNQLRVHTFYQDQLQL